MIRQDLNILSMKNGFKNKEQKTKGWLNYIKNLYFTTIPLTSYKTTIDAGQ